MNRDQLQTLKRHIGVTQRQIVREKQRIEQGVGNPDHLATFRRQASILCAIREGQREQKCRSKAPATWDHYVAELTGEADAKRAKASKVA